MPLDLSLDDLPAPRIAGIQMDSVIRTLHAITSRNLLKATTGGESRQLKNRKEEMKRCLKNPRQGVSFEQVTHVTGRERILISLYLDYATRPDASWLPDFDGAVADSVLGASGREWHAGRRRQATQLFFTHFDQLPVSGLSRLCARLVESYDSMESEGQGPVIHWHRHRKLLFSPPGHQSVARSAGANETLPSLIERFAIPSNGRFAECLRQVFLLNALKCSPLGKEIPALTAIESLKTDRASASQLMGAAALQIMVQRVANEGGRKWTGDWPNWITRLGCDPRHGRATTEGAKWWLWATDDELRLAQQGITGLTLHFFIDFLRLSLQGTDKEPQFAPRARFLRGLYESGKIQSARLALNWSAYYQQLDKKYHDVWSVAHLSATTDDTSMICLKCVDDIFVIEGTHSFGLRMFHKHFPIHGFWENPRQRYQDRELRISQNRCVFLPHDHGGRWVRKFFRELRDRFHVEWSDVPT